MICDKAWIKNDEIRKLCMVAYLMSRGGEFTTKSLKGASDVEVENKFFDQLELSNRRLAQNLWTARSKSS